MQSDGTPDCAIVDVGHQRDLDLSIEVPDQELGPIVTHDIWAELYEIVSRVKAHRTTLVFVNTRRLVERVAHQLTTRLGEGKVGAHHGSLSRKTRLEVEEGLKTGALARRGKRDKSKRAQRSYRSLTGESPVVVTARGPRS